MKAAILFFLLLAGFACEAQQFLAVDRFRFGRVRRNYIYPGTPLKYKTKEGIRKDTITGMNDSLLIFKSGDVVKLREIEVIYFSRTVPRVFRHWMSVAGLGLIAIDSFNHLVNNERPLFVNRILVIGGSVFVTGQLMRLFETKRLRPGKRLHLHVIDISLK